MDGFFQTFAPVFGSVAALCAGVIVLAVFFVALNRLRRAFGEPAVIKMRGFLKDAKHVNIHLAGGRVLEAMTFVGFTDPNSLKGGRIPYQLSNMVVLENTNGNRVLVRADMIKMIEEVGERNAAGSGAK